MPNKKIDYVELRELIIGFLKTNTSGLSESDLLKLLNRYYRNQKKPTLESINTQLRPSLIDMVKTEHIQQNSDDTYSLTEFFKKRISDISSKYKNLTKEEYLAEIIRVLKNLSRWIMQEIFNSLPEFSPPKNPTSRQKEERQTLIRKKEVNVVAIKQLLAFSSQSLSKPDFTWLMLQIQKLLISEPTVLSPQTQFQPSESLSTISNNPYNNQQSVITNEMLKIKEIQNKILGDVSILPKKKLSILHPFRLYQMNDLYLTIIFKPELFEQSARIISSIFESEINCLPPSQIDAYMENFLASVPLPLSDIIKQIEEGWKTHLAEINPSPVDLTTSQQDQKETLI